MIVLNKEEKKLALKIARETLESYLLNGRIPKIEVNKSSALQKKLGTFVTLKKDGQLRGCIGRFEPDEPLWKIVQEMAIASAIEDFRFPPVAQEELKNVKIEISVMTPKRKINDWRRIRLGVDGVVIEKFGRSGTFLPQVATETGWDLETFLSELCSQKAGLAPDSYKDSKTNIYIFQVQNFEERR